MKIFVKHVTLSWTRPYNSTSVNYKTLYDIFYVSAWDRGLTDYVNYSNVSVPTLYMCGTSYTFKEPEGWSKINYENYICNLYMQVLRAKQLTELLADRGSTHPYNVSSRKCTVRVTAKHGHTSRMPAQPLSYGLHTSVLMATIDNTNSVTKL